MEKISITSNHKLSVDETGTVFIEYKEEKEAIEIILPVLINNLIAIHNKFDPDDEYPLELKHR